MYSIKVQKGCTCHDFRSLQLLCCRGKVEVSLRCRHRSFEAPREGFLLVLLQISKSILFIGFIANHVVF